MTLSVHPLNNESENINKIPNLDSQKFFNMLNAAEEELCPGCEKYFQLSVVARMLNIKSEHYLSDRFYDALLISPVKSYLMIISLWIVCIIRKYLCVG